MKGDDIVENKISTEVESEKINFFESFLKSLKNASLNIGEFTFFIFSQIPTFFIFLAKLIKKLIIQIKLLFLFIFEKVKNPVVHVYEKSKDAVRALLRKSKAAYKSGGIKAMAKAAVLVFKEGFDRNRQTSIKVFNYVIPACAIFILGLTVLIFSNLTFGLVVEYDGIKVGNIQHESVYDTAEKQLMQRVLFEEDDGVEIIPKFKLAVVGKNSFLNSDQVTDELIKASSSVIEEASGLYVDDIFVGAVKDKKALEDILNSILDKYKTDNPEDIVTFVKAVAVKDGLYPTSSISDIDKIKEKITGETSAEVIYTVAKGDTPYEVARRAGISLDTLYSLNPIAKTTFVVGQQITIASSEPFLSVKVLKTEVMRETVKYKTITTKNNSYYTSYRNVTRKGKNGVNEVTYTITYLNGIATSREVVNTVVISEPVDEKITVGTKVQSNYVAPSLSASSGSGKVPGFIWPTSGRISCRWWGYYNHRGLDIAAPKGTPIYAVADGTVIAYKNLSSGYGKHIIIDHGNGVQTLYAHTSAVHVRVGQKVSQGQVVAAVGRTGWATGNHLHFGVMINGVYYNPEKYLP